MKLSAVSFPRFSRSPCRQGIEIDAERHDAGVRLQQIFEELHLQFGGADMSGKARLICGDFVDYRDEVRERRMCFRVGRLARVDR